MGRPSEWNRDFIAGRSLEDDRPINHSQFFCASWLLFPERCLRCLRASHFLPRLTNSCPDFDCLRRIVVLTHSPEVPLYDQSSFHGITVIGGLLNHDTNFLTGDNWYTFPTAVVRGGRGRGSYDNGKGAGTSVVLTLRLSRHTFLRFLYNNEGLPSTRH